MATLTQRLEDAFFHPEDIPNLETHLERIRTELGELPEFKLRQLLQEFGAMACESGTPEEDLLSWWSTWELPLVRVAETSGRRRR